MFGISLVSLDAKNVEPIAIIGLAGIAGYFLYTHLKQQQASSQPSAYEQAANQTTAALETQQQMYLLQELYGSSAGTGTTISTQNATPSTPQTIPIIAAQSAYIPSNSNTSAVSGTANPGSI